MLNAAGNPLKGVDCLISKPFLLENLREAIAKVCAPEARAVPESASRSAEIRSPRLPGQSRDADKKAGARLPAGVARPARASTL